MELVKTYSRNKTKDDRLIERPGNGLMRLTQPGKECTPQGREVGWQGWVWEGELKEGIVLSLPKLNILATSMFKRLDVHSLCLYQRNDR